LEGNNECFRMGMCDFGQKVNIFGESKLA